MHEAELAGLHQPGAGGLLVGDHNSLLNNMGNLSSFTISNPKVKSNRKISP